MKRATKESSALVLSKKTGLKMKFVSKGEEKVAKCIPPKE